jgi:hypothetical protein
MTILVRTWEKVREVFFWRFRAAKLKLDTSSLALLAKGEGRHCKCHKERRDARCLHVTHTDKNAWPFADEYGNGVVLPNVEKKPSGNYSLRATPLETAHQLESAAPAPHG